MNENERRLVEFLDSVMNFTVRWRLKLIPANPYYASSTRRLTAVFIDLLIYMSISAVFMLVFFEPSARGLSQGHLRNFFGQATSVVFLVFFVILPTPLMSTLLFCRRKHNGQTFGKQMMNIQVKRDDGQQWTLGPALKRQVLYKMVLIGFVSLFPMALASVLYENAHQPFLGSAVFVLMVVGWLVYGLLPMRSERRQSWHDRRMRCHVARTNLKTADAA